MIEEDILERLREKRLVSGAWEIFQTILEGHVEGYPKRFIELEGPVERIFWIRYEAFYDPDLRLNASSLVVAELNALDENQRDLLETEIVPIITRAFNMSKIVDSMRFKGNRDHH